MVTHMAVSVRHFLCEVDFENQGAPESSYELEDVPLTGNTLSVVYRSGVGYIVTIHGDFDLTLINPGGSRTIRPIPVNGTPVAMSTFVGSTVYEGAGQVLHWFQDAL